MNKKVKTVNHKYHAATLLPTAVFSVGLMSAPIAHATIASPDEVIVTARRTEEVIQNVPISMTVFNQEMLSERNVSSAADLVNYTPSLNVDSRFGSDNTSFSIRGFTQDLRTTASVAVYFADVVAPRGAGAITAGDGAGPGSFFDLQNVQILKGPQGTLFGRNTTGGAIQLVPHEPTNQLEGYLEQSAGNYNMRRTQGVLNVPINDKLRARLGFDTQKRDGYLVNQSGIGPDRLADIGYLAGRGSLIWEITDSLQNYTILTHSSSENNGNVQKLLGCNPGGFYGALCAATGALARQGNGFYDVMGETPDAVNRVKQYQAINTTTWTVNDGLTLKNNLSYAHLQNDSRTTVFGSNLQLAGPTLPPTALAVSWQAPGVPTGSQESYVEELQASGTAFDSKLTWQAGIYYETSKPDGWSGAQSPTYLACDQASLGNNPATWNCLNLIAFPTGAPAPFDVARLGSVSRSLAQVEYTNKAVYSQATYEFTDQFRTTLGLRYTVDEVDADMQQTVYSDTFGGPLFAAQASCTVAGLLPSNDCRFSSHSKSEAPTGLIGFDYLPTPDIMIYAKYSRGYRQGSIVTAAPIGYQSYEPESVNAYEIGAKTSFQGPIPGTFNAALFYNELSDQQLQLGLTPQPGTPGSSTTAIVNAGASTIQGLEVETTLKLLEPLTFNLGYTYLDTHLDKLNFPAIAGWDSHPSTVEGGHLTFSPRHTVVTGLSYEFPLPAAVGKVSAGANYTFTSSQNSGATTGAGGSPFSALGARQLLNLNMGWKSIFGSDFDASLFVTNALNEQYINFVSGLYNGTGAEFGVTGEPKMWGARVKYNFGK